MAPKEDNRGKIPLSIQSFIEQYPQLIQESNNPSSVVERGAQVISNLALAHLYDAEIHELLKDLASVVAQRSQLPETMRHRLTELYQNVTPTTPEPSHVLSSIHGILQPGEEVIFPNNINPEHKPDQPIKHPDQTQSELDFDTKWDILTTTYPAIDVLFSHPDNHTTYQNQDYFKLIAVPDLLVNKNDSDMFMNITYFYTYLTNYRKNIASQTLGKKLLHTGDGRTLWVSKNELTDFLWTFHTRTETSWAKYIITSESRDSFYTRLNNPHKKIDPLQALEASLYEAQPDDSINYLQHNLLTKEQEIQLGKFIQAGLQAQMQLQEHSYTPYQTTKLQEAIQTGRRAEHLLILHNLKLVIDVAKRYSNLNGSNADLIQDGNLGLMNAVLRYDPEKGYRFSTYATWWIMQSMTRRNINNDSLIRIPTHALEDISRLRKTINQFLNNHHRYPTDEEIAQYTGFSHDKITLLYNTLRLQVLSLDETLNPYSDNDYHEWLADDSPALEETVELNELQEMVLEAIKILLPTHQQIIIMRFGLLGETPRTLEEVGEKMNLSRERIRQLEKQALTILSNSKFLQTLKVD